jgi:hypothetical protein
MPLGYLVAKFDRKSSIETNLRLWMVLYRPIDSRGRGRCMLFAAKRASEGNTMLRSLATMK